MRGITCNWSAFPRSRPGREQNCRLALPAVQAGARSQSRGIDTNSWRRGNPIGCQPGAKDNRKSAVRVPRGRCSGNITRRDEAGTPEADAIAAWKVPVGWIIRAV